MSAAKSLAELKHACEHWKLGDSDGFQRIVAQFLAQLGAYQRDLAFKFEVAESTVSRWARGTARPHKLVQRVIVDKLRETIEQVMAKKTRRAARKREVVQP